MFQSRKCKKKTTKKCNWWVKDECRCMYSVHTQANAHTETRILLQDQHNLKMSVFSGCVSLDVFRHRLLFVFSWRTEQNGKVSKTEKKKRKNTRIYCRKLNTKSFELQTETLQNKVRVSKVLAKQSSFFPSSLWLWRERVTKTQRERLREIKIKHEPVFGSKKRPATTAAKVQIFAMNKSCCLVIGNGPMVSIYDVCVHAVQWEFLSVCELRESVCEECEWWTN